MTTYWTPGLQAEHRPEPRSPVTPLAPRKHGGRVVLIRGPYVKPKRDPRLRPYPKETADWRTLEQLATLSGQTVEQLLWARNALWSLCPREMRRIELAQLAEQAKGWAAPPPPEEDDDLPF